jgi:hypothetical protein
MIKLGIIRVELRRAVSRARADVVECFITRFTAARGVCDMCTQAGALNRTDGLGLGWPAKVECPRIDSADFHAAGPLWEAAVTEASADGIAVIQQLGTSEGHGTRRA